MRHDNFFSTLKAKLLRALGITKPIQLSKEEVQWIKLCKLHYSESSTSKDKGKYPSKGEWTETMKPLFNEIYGWTAGDHPADYLDCIFNKLLDIYLKIRLPNSDERELREVFKASFYKDFFREQELPIERAIGALCGKIQNNLVIQNGVNRYYLND